MRPTLAVLYLLFVVTLSAANPCRWGPSYWCRDRATAEGCGQVRYCESNIWKKNEAQVVDEERPKGEVECQLCELVVGYADTFLNSSATESDVEEALERICSYLGGLATECDKFVEDYFPDIWKALLNDVTPKEVCDMLGLCTSATKKNVEKETGIDCTVCKMIVEFVDQYIDNNDTEAEAEAIVEKYCSILGSFEAECKAFIETYFPDLWKLLQEETDPDKVCTELGLCTSASVKKLPKVEKETGIDCTVCKMIVEFVDQYIDNNDTEAEAEAIVEKYCSILGSFEAECKAFIEKYFPDLWKLLQEETNPDIVCAELGLCTSASVKKLPKVEKVTGIDCTVCKMIVEFVDQYVDSNDTEAEAEAIVEKFCNGAGPFAEDCKEFVEKYFPDLWKLLQKETDPDVVCTELGLCTSAAVKKVKVPKINTCEICKVIVDIADKFLDSNKTEGEVQAALEDVCQYFGNMAGECKSLIEDFFPEIWNLLINEASPDTICDLIGVCSSTTAVKKVSAPRSVSCAACTMVVMVIKEFVDNNRTEADAKKALEEFCGIVGPLKSECDELVNELFSTIWELLMKELTPSEVCEQLGLCPKLKPQAIKSDEECDFCKDACEFLQMFLDNNATEEEVYDFLKMACELFPTFQDQCQTILNDFEQFWKLLRSEVDNDEICYQFGLCTMKVSVATRKAAAPKADTVCELCKFVVKYALKPLVDRNASEGEVKAALEEFCNILPSEFKAPCQKYVNEDFDLFWTILKQEADDGELCALLELCNDTISVATKPMVGMSVPTEEKTEGILCEICELVMEKIASLLVNNATETEILDLVEKICTFFPEPEQKYCDEFINEYGKKIIQALVDGVGARAVCTIIHLCFGEERKFSVSDFKSSDCSACKIVLEFVKQILGEDFTKSAVEAALDDVCKLLPSELTQECVAFVNQYSGTLIQLIDDSINPEALCEELKLCPKSSTLASPWKMMLPYMKN